MGVIRIFDRQHESGKAWKWDTGANFPAGSWREEQQRLKQRRARVNVDSGDLPSPSSMGKEEKVHNTLYETDSSISGGVAARQAIRPPP